MSNLYITADDPTLPGGAGSVIRSELEALRSLGECELLDRRELLKPVPYCFSEYNFWEDVVDLQKHHERDETNFHYFEPWVWDGYAYYKWKGIYKWKAMIRNPQDWENPKLAHFYEGTFSHTIKRLKESGCKVTCTAEAHDIAISKREWEKTWAIPFEDQNHFPTDPKQFKRYIEGYLLADVVICPSTISANIMRSYGCKRVEIIPHGCTLPAEVKPLPEGFVVGYLGAIGPSKGLGYLLQAWRKLNYKDGLLLIVGQAALSDCMRYMLLRYGNHHVGLVDWVEDVAEFYNRISVLVQPSSTEAWGLTVTEAMAYGRVVLCSDGAGSRDVVPKEMWFESCNVNAIADAIDKLYRNRFLLEEHGDLNRFVAEKFQWPAIQQQYVGLWKSLL